MGKSFTKIVKILLTVLLLRRAKKRTGCGIDYRQSGFSLGFELTRTWRRVAPDLEYVLNLRQESLKILELIIRMN